MNFKYLTELNYMKKHLKKFRNLFSLFRVTCQTIWSKLNSKVGLSEIGWRRHVFGGLKKVWDEWKMLVAGADVETQNESSKYFHETNNFKIVLRFLGFLI